MRLAAKKRSVRITAARTLVAATSSPRLRRDGRGRRNRRTEQAPQQRRGSADASLAARLVDGDKRALARAISLVENRDPAGDELVAELFPRTGEARIVGLTGPPGVGKSTLIGAIVEKLREADREVGVLSIDPSSPFTQGAVLGDRIRLSEHFLDPGVFIRSMATRGSLGGLAEAALQAALLMDASGKDDILLETVGVGQGEIDIVDHADTVVLALMPGSGDSIQALKAGVMEIPDVIVVNKAEHPLADTMIREVKAVLALGPTPRLEGAGGPHRGLEGGGDRRARRRPRRAPPPHRRGRDAGRAPGAQPARRGARDRRRADAPRARGKAAADPEWQALLDRVVSREIDPATAARELLEKELARWHAEIRRRPARPSLEAWVGYGLDDVRGVGVGRIDADRRRRAPVRSGCSRAWAASATTRRSRPAMRSRASERVWVPYSRDRSATRRMSRRSRRSTR